MLTAQTSVNKHLYKNETMPNTHSGHLHGENISMGCCIKRYSARSSQAAPHCVIFLARDLLVQYQRSRPCLSRLAENCRR